MNERAWLVVGAVGAVLFVASLAGVLGGGGLAALDAPVAAHYATASDALVSIAQVVSTLGDTIAIAIVVVGGAALLWWACRPWAALRLVAVPVAAELAVLVVKNVVKRPRPLDALAAPEGYAFPSGHATNAAAFFCLLLWAATSQRARRTRGATVALIAAATVWLAIIAIDRLVLRVHRFTDVTGAIGLGLAMGALALIAVERVRAKRPHLLDRFRRDLAEG